MGDPGVQMSRERAEALNTQGAAGHSTPVGFLNIDKAQLVQRMMLHLLIEPGLKKAKKRKKKTPRNFF